MASPRSRLDALLVARGLFATRAKAQAALLAGKVRLEGCAAPKAGQNVPLDAVVEVLADAVPYVSRGGVKLAAALDAFAVPIQGRVALDLGSSTGGFTDCLLQRGASKVYAVDVGRAQLDASLRADPRVVPMEETHARDLRAQDLVPAPDLAVVDVSFISLPKVLPSLIPCLSKPFDLIALIKPQFELGPKKAPKGVVREEAYRREAVAGVRAALPALGLAEKGLIESPLRGAKGNVEYLLWCQTCTCCTFYTFPRGHT